MPFIEDILNYKSLSIVGLEKNTGKTECLNYVLKKLPVEKLRVAVSSIGIDGEGIDQVTHTTKPEIYLRQGMFFSTSEKHYKTRKIISELIDVTNESTALGRIVTAKALTKGKVMLSGPSSGIALKRWMLGLEKFQIDLVIIDGALSRLSSASPAISESMILATGAAYSANLNTLVQKTAFVVELIKLPLAHETVREQLDSIHQGVWAIDKSGVLHDLEMSSSLLMNEFPAELPDEVEIMYISGALTDRMLNMLRQHKKLKDTQLLVRDFTKIFVTQQSYRAFQKAGGKLQVLQRSELIAICVNPTSPSGYVLDSDKLREKLSKAIALPVYDIVKNNYAV